MKTVHSISSLSGSIQVPGDKSISHRAVMLAAIAEGITEINGFLNGEDCLHTIKVFKQLGVEIEQTGETAYKVKGNGLYSLKEPKDVLYVGNSGTTIRLTSGILAGQPFYSVLTGDQSIIRRPMKRVIEPLRKMGAFIDGKENGRFAPITIRGGSLHGISYESPIASAQVKSAILLAGLYADTQTTFIEPYRSRDHSEKLLAQFGAKLEIKGRQVTIFPKPRLEAQSIQIPGDFSSAAFFIAAALIVPNSRIEIRNVGLNETRIGFLEIVKKMNGKVEITDQRFFGQEVVGDLIIESSSLHGIEISGEMIPRLIDELPLLAVLASQAEGTTKVTDAKELRVKETDRIETISTALRNVGVEIEELEDGFIIKGKQKIRGGVISTKGDHRIGMAMAIAGLIAVTPIIIHQSEAIHVSYPQFFEDLKQLAR
ncbi:3-phosphoshikimate 1-carboxyvinyltransferase [Tepidibacillus sp. LV47]|uniref:3-phosphoshikimate 1-carboxyvinyltransferase n=1 Tax=Tepidibacillus sp. LV47 TaxID=3398228 RepID=UPI003AAA8F8F